jgi:hypothetical protein
MNGRSALIGSSHPDDVGTRPVGFADILIIYGLAVYGGSKLRA